MHINAWAGTFDNAPMALRCLHERFSGLADPSAWVFVGDAPNDASMFAQFRRSVGVANLARFADRLPATPAFLTRAGYGSGFVELADHLLRGLTSPPTRHHPG